MWPDNSWPASFTIALRGAGPKDSAPPPPSDESTSAMVCGTFARGVCASLLPNAAPIYRHIVCPPAQPGFASTHLLAVAAQSAVTRALIHAPCGLPVANTFKRLTTPPHSRIRRRYRPVEERNHGHRRLQTSRRHAGVGSGCGKRQPCRQRCPGTSGQQGKLHDRRAPAVAGQAALRGPTTPKTARRMLPPSAGVRATEDL